MGTSNYSDEFKRDAVHQITVRGYPVREVSRRLGVSTHSLYKWMKLFGDPAPKKPGVDHDGNEYIMLFESEPGGVLNIYNSATFATFNDLLSFSIANQQFLGQNYLSPTRSIGGFAGVSGTDPVGPGGDPNVVPLPAALTGSITSVLLLGAIRFRRGRKLRED